MKRAVILGYQYIDFQPDGKERITGYKVFFAVDGGENVTGQKSVSCWMNPAKFAEARLGVGEVRAVCFNEQGKVEAFLPEEVLAYVA